MEGQPSAREHPRFAVDALVQVASASGGLLRGRTRNISRGGLCVELDAELAAGEEVEVRIALRFEDRRQTEPLALPARIVWCTPLGHGCQIGSQFRRLSEEQQAYLDLLLGYMDDSPHRVREVADEPDGAEDDPFAR